MNRTRRATRLYAVGLLAVLCAPAAAGAAPDAARREIIDNLTSEGVQSFQHRQYSSSIALLKKAAELDKRSPKAFFHLGQAYYRRAFSRERFTAASRGDVRAAIAAYERVKKLDPKLQSLPEPYVIYHGLAMCDEALHRREAALVALGLAMRLAPRNPMPALYSARVRYAMGDAEGSSRDLNESFVRAERLGRQVTLAQMVRKDPGFTKLLRAPENRALVRRYDPLNRKQLLQTIAMNTRGEPEIYRDALAAKAPGLRARSPIQTGPRASSAASLVGDVHYQRALAYSLAGKFSQAMRSLDQAFESVSTSPAELRRILILAKISPELDPLRDQPAFWKTLQSYSARLSRTR